MSKKSFLRNLLPVLMGCAVLMSSSLPANPPEQSGPNVFRFQDFYWNVFVANEMAAFVGLDIPELCIDGDPVDEWNWQVVENPSDLEIWIAQIKLEDATTYIYPASAALEDGWPDFEKLCLYISGNDEIASGTTNAIYTHNEASASRNHNDRSRTGTFHMSVQGILLTPTEDPVTLNGGIHCVWKAWDDFWVKCKEEINLSD